MSCSCQKGLGINMPATLQKSASSHISATSPPASPDLFFKVTYSIAGITKPSEVIVGHYLSLISPGHNLLQPVGNQTARAGQSKSTSGKATGEKALIGQCQLARSFYTQSGLLKTKALKRIKIVKCSESLVSLQLSSSQLRPTEGMNATSRVRRLLPSSFPFRTTCF